MYILALADDMTGALEIGAKFSAAGIQTLVSATPISMGSAHAVVLDTETRHVDTATAALEIRRFVAAWGKLQPRLIFKKTDSTLRGNIAAELGALAELYPGWSVGYAPAYPALGRTVTAGILYVHGRAVSETEFALDALNPIRNSSIAAMLGPELACTVFDGECDAHLAESAREILSNPVMRIAAGPAALAEAIAAQIEIPRRDRGPLPGVRTCLVMNGSRHGRSAAQIRNFQTGEWQVLPVRVKQGGDAEQIARANGALVLEQIASQQPDAVFTIGGDTSFAVVRELGFPLMTPMAEVVPGVPVTRIAAADLQGAIPGRQRDLILITKAGGFGEEDVLTRVHAKLSHDNSHDHAE